MKRLLKGFIPFLLILGILISIGWYLLVYDREFTRDMLIAQARHMDSMGNADFAAKLYDLAYDYTGKDEDVAIELANQYRNDGNYTKAEYTLTNAISDGGTVDLYMALCKTYVEQDKLQDAVAMLASISDPVVKREIEALRPAAPQPIPEPGFYNEYIHVEFASAPGKIYYTTNGEYPTVSRDPYTDPIAIEGGETIIYAVNVDSNGLVSPLTIAGYTVSGVIEVAQFQDPVIEQALRAQLGMEEDEILMTDRLWSVTEFAIPEGTQSLSDLVLLPYLEKLTIADYRLDNLSSLATLGYLKELDLSGSRFPASELKVIAGLPRLEKLTLSQCNLSTIAELSGAMNLKYLDLSGNTLRNLEPLIPMNTLQELYLQHNAVTSLEALSALTGLQKLDVSYNSITNLSPLAGCTSLYWLHAGHNSIADLTGMDSFSALTHLYLDNNQLTTVSVLSKLSGLEELDLSHNNIRVVESLGKLNNLVKLNISYNDVYQLPKWNSSSLLSILDASHNHVENVLPLMSLENLTYLYLDYNQIWGLDPIAGCYRLVMVNAYGNHIKDVSALTERNIIVNYDPTSD